MNKLKVRWDDYERIEHTALTKFSRYPLAPASSPMQPRPSPSHRSMPVSSQSARIQQGVDALETPRTETVELKACYRRESEWGGGGREARGGRRGRYGGNAWGALEVLGVQSVAVQNLAANREVRRGGGRGGERRAEPWRFTWRHRKRAGCKGGGGGQAVAIHTLATKRERLGTFLSRYAIIRRRALLPTPLLLHSSSATMSSSSA